MENEQGETIQFYKIQLMEKDRQISGFEARMKKTQFKHSRELKQAKMAQQRATGLLKQQKAKIDKITKQAKQNQEQNTLLQMRLNELKQEKEKEVTQVKAQYNKIKEQVRSYERILPTHTFLSECGISISQLLTYEDIFTNLKEKSYQFEQLNNKFQAFKQKHQEELEFLRLNQEHLKEKKIKSQKNLEEVLPKLQESQSIINDLKSAIQQLQYQLNDTRNELQVQKHKNSGLEELLKQNDAKIQQISQAFTNQVHNKQEELKFSFQEEIQRYEAEIRNLTSRFEVKENMFLSQISIHEEDSNYLKAKLQEEKEKYEEIIQEAKQQISLNKEQVLKQRKNYEEKLIQNEANKKQLINLSKLSQELQAKLKIVQGRLRETEEKLQQGVKYQEEELERKLTEVREKTRLIEKSNQILKTKCGELQQEKQRLTQELAIAKIQKSAQIKDNLTKNSLDIPGYFEEYNEKIRKASNEFDKHDEEIQLISVHKEEYVRQRAKTIETIKQLEDFQVQIAKLNEKNEELFTEKIALNQNVHNLTIKNQTLQQKILKNQNLLKQNNSQLQKLLKQVEQIKAQKEKLKLEIESLKDSLNSSNKVISQQENKINESNTKINLQKTKIQSLQQESRLTNEQSKKDKQLNKGLKDQLKRLKEEISNLNQKFSTQIKIYLSQLQLLKEEKLKLTTQISAHEKQIQNNNILIQKFKENEEKMKKQAADVQKKLVEYQGTCQEQEKTISQLNKQVVKQKKYVEKLQEQILQKDRQHQLLSSSLERERRQRTLRHVPSLQALDEDQTAQEQNFNEIYSKVTEKEGQINFLQRQISDLKEEMQALKQNHITKIQLLQGENNDYVQTIITMKMKCAESQMRASEKEHLYNQLKKKMSSLSIK